MRDWPWSMVAAFIWMGSLGEVGDLSDLAGIELEFAFVVGEFEERLKEEFTVFDTVFTPTVDVSLSEEMII